VFQQLVPGKLNEVFMSAENTPVANTISRDWMACLDFGVATSSPVTAVVVVKGGSGFESLP
jgi:hypothetical protein